VFCPTYRYLILTDEVGAYVNQEIYRLCLQKDGVEILEANVQADHVHIILSI
jgi:REP element-mobilizing transposase RayT